MLSVQTSATLQGPAAQRIERVNDRVSVATVAGGEDHHFKVLCHELQECLSVWTELDTDGFAPPAATVTPRWGRDLLLQGMLLAVLGRGGRGGCAIEANDEVMHSTVGWGRRSSCNTRHEGRCRASLARGAVHARRNSVPTRRVD